MNIKEIVKKVEKEYKCNCDLDNWQPQLDTGHSCVCRIDSISRERFVNQKPEKCVLCKDEFCPNNV